MRMFFIVVGILSWIWSLAVLWIFAESGGALTVIAAGVFAGVAIVALGCERVLKTLEDIRDGRAAIPGDSGTVVVRRAGSTVTPTLTPAVTPGARPAGEMAI